MPSVSDGSVQLCGGPAVENEGTETLVKLRNVLFPRLRANETNIFQQQLKCKIFRDCLERFEFKPHIDGLKLRIWSSRVDSELCTDAAGCPVGIGTWGFGQYPP
jgi:hypothetical protein